MKMISHRSFSTTKKTISAVKRVIEATRTAIAFLCSVGWVATLIIMLIALIVGIFIMGSSSSGEGNQLSSEVIAHTATIQKYADKYEISHFLNTLQAL